MDPTNGGIHVKSERIAAYLDGRLPAPELKQFESHVADCVTCRREVLSIAQTLSGRSRSPLVTAGFVAAAAVLVLVLVLAPADGRGGATSPVARQRSPTAAEIPSVSGLSPADGTVLDESEVTFAWRWLEADAMYRVTVLNADGDEIWSGDTEDSTISLPADIALQPSERYFWRVDALLRGGRPTASTTFLRFEIRPR